MENATSTAIFGSAMSKPTPKRNLGDAAVNHVMPHRRGQAVLLSGLLMGALACVPPDCDRPDSGTCVGACCKLQWTVPSLPPKTFADLVASFLGSQGTDGRYTLSQNNPTVQNWNSSTSSVVQGQHISAKNLYIDSLSIAAVPDGRGGSVALGFSHSQEYIPANFAEGDHGQNYKNLATLIKGLNVTFSEDTLLGCPKPPSSGGACACHRIDQSGECQECSGTCSLARPPAEGATSTCQQSKRDMSRCACY
jgi:hypothetical protein